MTLICPKCGAKNKDDAISCRICGRVIGDGVEQSKPKHYRSAWGYIGLLILLIAIILTYLWLAGTLPSILHTTTTVTSQPTTTIGHGHTTPTTTVKPTTSVQKQPTTTTGINITIP